MQGDSRHCARQRDRSETKKEEGRRKKEEGRNSQDQDATTTGPILEDGERVRVRLLEGRSVVYAEEAKQIVDERKLAQFKQQKHDSDAADVVRDRGRPIKW